jgi:phosphatidylglycerophosphatase A
MVIKESSDELNPTVATDAAQVPRPRAARSLKDYLALAIATCGVGYLPLAPGTWGSLVGVVVYFLGRGVLIRVLFNASPDLRLNSFHLFYTVLAFELIVICVLVWAGIWAASRLEKLTRVKDPHQVVIDEVVGQYIALAALPFLWEPAWWSIVLAFLLFRCFDIVKPYPARKLESLNGGLGIMLDDVVAGIYAAIAVMLVVSIRWFI